MAKVEKFTKKDFENNKHLAIISYLFAPISYYSKSKKNSKMVNFHASQGMNLFLIEIVYILLSIALLDNIKIIRECTNSLYGITFYCGEENPLYIKLIVILLGILVLSIIITGIVNVFNRKKDKLPLIGKWNLFK